MKVQIQSRKLVKPCTPTPPHLRRYHISLIDDLNPPMHVHRILYYPPHSLSSINTLLQQSLARVLPLFYPLAGKYVQQNHRHAAAPELVDLDRQHRVGGLVGGGYVDGEEAVELLWGKRGGHERTEVAVDSSFGEVRAVVVAVDEVCASHRIFDACSLGIFLTAWANTSVRGEPVVTPDFSSASFFPSENAAQLEFGVSRAPDWRIVCRRIMFDKNAISRLRDMAKCERPPSRVVVVSAFLTQALLRADRARHGGSRASLIAQAINVRERTAPPVPEHACGTWVSMSYFECNANESKMIESDYPGLVLKMRETTIKGIEDCAKILTDKEFGRWVLVDSYAEMAKKGLRSDYKVIYVTDWSKFGDNELDIGFGKPVWVSLVNVPLEDLFVLMNTKENDGIEAWVYLHQSNMPYFLEDEYIRMMMLSVYGGS